jgi:hypothetical protein
MTRVRRLVLDVLKPHDPPLVEFTRQVGETESVESVTASLLERDKEVQNIELAFEGADLDAGAIEAGIEGLGASVHSVDRVACGEPAENPPTPRDG